MMMGPFVIALLLPAHGGAPSIAPILEPIGVGNVVDRTLEVRWRDLDMPIPTGTATVDLSFTRIRPATFDVGEIPSDLTGAYIVRGILEKDQTNMFVWDTSTVAAGSYWVYSFVNEPPSEMDPFPVVSFSPGVVTVAHPGDPIEPAIVLLTPDDPYDFGADSFDVTYAAFDPDGSGRVTIEAYHRLHGDRVTIAEDLTAKSEETVRWNTRELAEGDWILTAELTDGRGYTFRTYAVFPLWITHLVGRPDAGVVDGGAAIADAGSTRTLRDGGVGIDETPTTDVENEGCTCVRRGRLDRAWLGLLWLLLPLVLRRSASAANQAQGK